MALKLHHSTLASPSTSFLTNPSLLSSPHVISAKDNGKWGKLQRSVMAQAKDDEKAESKRANQSWLSSVVDALDFSQVRSAEDGSLIEEARESTKSGKSMNKEQYGALRRKIGGTYKDFFKSYVEVDGQYVEEGWVDKTCKVCKKDTNGEARQVDKLGRYVHVSCINNKSTSNNFFSRLFSR